MLGDSAMLGGGGGGGGGEHGGSGDATPAAGTTHDLTAAAATSGGGGGIGSNSGSDDVEKGRIDEGERSFGGNRWPRQETLALLRIRSDMDVAFRDASVKGPLWEQVSRKLAELGYHRNAKKCKEKFENVYKYHKRTKDGRGGKSDGKTYRFFDQLEALDHHHQQQQQQPPPLSLPAPPQLLVTTPPMSLPINTATTVPVPVPVPVPMPPVSNITNATISVPNVTVSSTTSLPTPPFVTNTTPPPPMSLSYPTTFQQPSTTNPTTTSFPNIPTDLLSNYSSSSTSSDETLEGTRKRKRKWKDFFERLMKEVIEKQEELHKRFLEAIEKREHERMVREEVWRNQELQRINREREILAQERSIASAKDSAVMSFLQKIAEQQNQNLPQAFTNINIPQPVSVPPPPPQVQETPPPPPQKQQPQPVAQAVMVVPQQQQVQQQQKQEMQVVTNMEIVKADNNNSGEKENTTGASSSRWPKVEVEALIKLRTSLDSKYQENGPKGPLWEEISGGMKKLGYNRNPKRCKEKWENINKYFKKVKESNKRRPEDSKTCPYFHQLDALYREKNKHEINVGGGGVKTAESMVAPLMVQPEQQWPPQQQQQQQEGNRDLEDNDNMDEDEEEGTGSGSGGSSNFEVVPSKPAMGGGSAE